MSRSYAEVSHYRAPYKNTFIQGYGDAMTTDTNTPPLPAEQSSSISDPKVAESYMALWTSKCCGMRYLKKDLADKFLAAGDKSWAMIQGDIKATSISGTMIPITEEIASKATELEKQYLSSTYINGLVAKGYVVFLPLGAFFPPVAGGAYPYFATTNKDEAVAFSKSWGQYHVAIGKSWMSSLQWALIVGGAAAAGYVGYKYLKRRRVVR